MTPYGYLPAPPKRLALPAGPLSQRPPEREPYVGWTVKPEDQSNPGDLLERDGKFYILLTDGLLLCEDGKPLEAWDITIWLNYRIIQRGYWRPEQYLGDVIAQYRRRMAREEYEPTYLLDYVEDTPDRFGQRTYALKYRRAG